MKWWSEAEGKFIEGESVWDGRSAVTSGDGWMYRQSYLAQTDSNDQRTRNQRYKAKQAQRRAGLSYEPSPKRQPNRCACGNTKSLRADRCKACWNASPKQNTMVLCSLCVSSGTLCWRCRTREERKGARFAICKCGQEMDRKAKQCDACRRAVEAKKPPREECALCRANGYLCRTCKARANGLRQMKLLSPSGTAA